MATKLKKKADPFAQAATDYQAQLDAARRAFGVQDAEAKAKAEQESYDSQVKGQQAYIDAIRTALLGRDENTKTLTAENQRLTEQQWQAPTAERQRLIDAGITDPFERQRRIDQALGNIQGNRTAVGTQLDQAKARREDLMAAGQQGYQTELTAREKAAQRLADQAKEQSGNALTFLSGYKTRQEKLADEERQRQNALIDYEKQKQIDARYRAPTGGTFDITDMMKSPLEAFIRAGGKRIQTKGGGFDFIGPDGSKITVEQAASLVPGATKADLLGGSESKVDQATIKEAAGKPTITAAAQKDINSISDALNVLGQIEANSKRINTKSGFWARLGDPLYRSQGLIGANPDVKRFQANQGYLSRVVRAMGEVGTLNEGDIQRASKLIPQLGDTAEEANNKIRDLRALLQKNLAQRQNPETLSLDPTLQDIVDTGI